MIAGNIQQIHNLPAFLMWYCRRNETPVNAYCGPVGHTGGRGLFLHPIKSSIQSSSNEGDRTSYVRTCEGFQCENEANY